LKFGVPEDRVEEAVTVFRSRYTTIGKFENTPYPSVHDLLQALKTAGHTLLIATSKPENMAVEILEKFELSQYFDRICGATLDRSRISKEDVIAYLLGLNGTAENMVMVGDTAFDVEGAAAHGISTIGVSWGYGSVEEMQQAGAIAIANTMEELLSLLK
jgi:phosphoglycolate phosphatase